jgi:hypothetical protein
MNEFGGCAWSAAISFGSVGNELLPGHSSKIFSQWTVIVSAWRDEASKITAQVRSGAEITMLREVLQLLDSEDAETAAREIERAA